MVSSSAQWKAHLADCNLVSASLNLLGLQGLCGSHLSTFSKVIYITAVVWFLSQCLKGRRELEKTNRMGVEARGLN